MHDRDLGGEVGQEQRFLDRGVAAADHDHFLAAIEEAVAGRAGGDAKALELLLGRQVEPARLRAGRDDQRVGEIDVAAIAGRAGTAAAPRSTLVTWSVTIRVPTCSACFCICSISQGPWMTSAKPG